MQQIDFKKNIYDWIRTIDSSIESLSNHYEGKLWSLPKWVLSKRKIKCYILPYDGIVVIIEANNLLQADEFTQKYINDLSAVEHDNFKPSGSFKDFDPIGFMSIFQIKLSNDSGHSRSVCMDDFIGYGKISGFLNVMSIDSARETAINFWNSAETNYNFSNNNMNRT